MDPKFSCRIGRGLGEFGTDHITGEVGLPNQSGWLWEKDLKRTTLTKLREAFKAEYPVYGPTAYLGTGNQTVWKHDPNNEGENPQSVKLGQALPMPPDKNASAEPDEDAAEGESDGEADESGPEGGDGDDGPDDDDALGPAAGGGNAPGEPREQAQEESPEEAPKGGEAKSEKKKPKITLKVKGAGDGTYRDRREAHSEDEEPHPDHVRADDPQGAPEPKKKKKAAKAPAAPATPAGGKTQGRTTIKLAARKPAALKRAAADEDGEGQPGAKRQKRDRPGPAAGRKAAKKGSRNGSKK